MRLHGLDFEIVEHLLRTGAATPRLLQHQIGKDGSYIRQRLKALERAGVVRRAGRGIYECARPGRPISRDVEAVGRENLLRRFELRGASASRTIEEGLEVSDFVLDT